MVAKSMMVALQLVGDEDKMDEALKMAVSILRMAGLSVSGTKYGTGETL